MAPPLKPLAVVDVPARVRAQPSSMAAAVDRLGGQHVCSHALNRRLPLEFRLSRSVTLLIFVLSIFSMS